MPLTPSLSPVAGDAAAPYKVPSPVAQKVSQMLLIDGQYYWAHPEVAATLAAYFKPNGELHDGYQVADFEAYVADSLKANRLQRCC